MIKFIGFLKQLSIILKQQIRVGIRISFLMTNHCMVLNIGHNSKSGNRKFAFSH